MSISQTPAFNLKAVLKETGLKADMLRAWERRYGLPMPQRSQGGHRLYSQRDIETIKWLIARQNEGLSISRAVDLWREIEAKARDPLAETMGSSIAGPALYTPQASLTALRNEWLTGCLAFSESLADQALNQAFALYPVETVCTELIQRSLVEIGGLWYQGNATVQQEHFASGLATRRLDALLTACPPPTRSQTILVGCPPDEWHTLTALLLALFLRRRGLNVIYLGANVPDSRFRETVSAVHADLVVLVAQQLITAAGLQRIAAQLLADGVEIAFGGRILSMQPDLAAQIPGHFLGDSLDGVLERIETLLVAAPRPRPAVAAGNPYAETLGAFRQKRSSVEAALDETVKRLNIPLEYAYTAHQFLGDNLIAALSLGNLAYLDAEVSWLHAFLKSHRLPPTLVHDYLGLYADAVRSQVGPSAAPILAWIERQIKETIRG